MFNIPYHYPTWALGAQLFNPGNNGNGGSHPRELLTAPRVMPSVYDVKTYGIGNMPRQVFGPTNPIDVNQYSTPPSIQMMQIAGLFKS